MEEKEIKEERFTWVPFYGELADELAKYNDKRKDLWILIFNEFKDKKIIDFMLYGNGEKPIERIDPFTIFASFNRQISKDKRIYLCSIFKKIFSLENNIPNDFDGIPVLNSINSRMFGLWDTQNKIDEEIDDLWSLFLTALKYSKDKSLEIKNKFISEYDKLSKWNGIKYNITMALFWIRPKTYLNLDQVNRIELAKYIDADMSKVMNKVPSGEKYIEIIDIINLKIEKREIPYMTFYELSLAADTLKNKQKSKKDNNFPSTEEDSSDLTEQKVKGDKLKNISLNTILYGPPGTGKTYNTINYAVAIIDDKTEEEVEAENHDEVLERYNELRDKGLIEFITFHQSYGYEEFIEGIKPKISYNEENNINYEIKPGIFKKFCEEIKYKDNNDFDKFGLNEDPTVWKVSLAGTGDNPIRTDCFKNDRIRIGWDNYGPDILEDTDFTNGGKSIINAFINSMQIGDIVLSCYKEKIIDGIGVITGDYYWDDSLDKYKRVRKVKWILKNIHEDIYKLNNEKVMTLSTVYKLDIPLSEILKIVNANTDNSINVAGSNIMKKVFIIDEINRGNISKIFGELITLIEETKRNGNSEKIEIELPYSGTKFSVPNNIYILGTMNTADRSIALMDTALRRRFNFVEMMPDSSLLKDKKNVDGIDLEQLLKIMNKRIEYLYDREHTIGHAFFMKVDNLDDLKEVFLNKIIPLLQEYFYDDYKKINAVLGNNGFIQRENALRFTDLFSKEASEEIGDFSEIDEKEIYSIASSNSGIWNDVNAYKIIYEMKNDRLETDDDTSTNGESNE